MEIPPILWTLLGWGLTAWVLALALLVAAVVLSGGLGNVLRPALIYAGPRFFKAPIKCANVSLGPRGITISGFELGNPTGFSSPAAVSFSKLAVTVARIRPAPILLIVELDDYHVTYENLDGKSNLEVLGNNAGGGSSSDASKPAPPKPKEQKPSASRTTVVLKLLRLTKGAAVVHSVGSRIELPTVELSDLGSDSGGFEPQEVAELLVSVLMRTVIGSLAGAGYAVAKGFLHRLGDLACVLPGALGDVSNLAEKEAEEVANGLAALAGGFGALGEMLTQPNAGDAASKD
jgi:hypothetical protein